MSGQSLYETFSPIHTTLWQVGAFFFFLLYFDREVVIIYSSCLWPEETAAASLSGWEIVWQVRGSNGHPRSISWDLCLAVSKSGDTAELVVVKYSRLKTEEQSWLICWIGVRIKLFPWIVIGSRKPGRRENRMSEDESQLQTYFGAQTEGVEYSHYW